MSEDQDLDVEQCLEQLLEGVASTDDDLSDLSDLGDLSDSGSVLLDDDTILGLGESGHLPPRTTAPSKSSAVIKALKASTAASSRQNDSSPSPHPTSIPCPTSTSTAPPTTHSVSDSRGETVSVGREVRGNGARRGKAISLNRKKNMVRYVPETLPEVQLPLLARQPGKTKGRGRGGAYSYGRYFSAPSLLLETEEPPAPKRTRHDLRTVITGNRMKTLSEDDSSAKQSCQSQPSSEKAAVHTHSHQPPVSSQHTTGLMHRHTPAARFRHQRVVRAVQEESAEARCQQRDFDFDVTLSHQNNRIDKSHSGRTYRRGAVQTVSSSSDCPNPAEPRWGGGGEEREGTKPRDPESVDDSEGPVQCEGGVETVPRRLGGREVFSQSREWGAGPISSNGRASDLFATDSVTSPLSFNVFGSPPCHHSHSCFTANSHQLQPRHSTFSQTPTPSHTHHPPTPSHTHHPPTPSHTHHPPTPSHTHHPSTSSQTPSKTHHPPTITQPPNIQWTHHPPKPKGSIFAVKPGISYQTPSPEASIFAQRPGILPLYSAHGFSLDHLKPGSQAKSPSFCLDHL